MDKNIWWPKVKRWRHKFWSNEQVLSDQKSGLTLVMCHCNKTQFASSKVQRKRAQPYIKQYCILSSIVRTFLDGK